MGEYSGTAWQLHGTLQHRPRRCAGRAAQCFAATRL